MSEKRGGKKNYISHNLELKKRRGNYYFKKLYILDVKLKNFKSGHGPENLSDLIHVNRTLNAKEKREKL